MNKIITNLAQVADAAEYFDRKTGAAWKIRSALTNMGVWAANALVYALKSDSVERIATTTVVLATLRVWLRDSNTSALVLDLTPAAVARTLGLERVVDVHEEAKRIARQKCLQTRSALNFNKYYKSALDAFENQRKQRAESVEQIAQLLADNQMFMTHDLADHFEVYNLGTYQPESFANDADLYDDGAVERQADQLAETVGNALESMYDVCEAELAAAITADKVNRLTGYYRAIQNMLVITGVDMKKLGERRAKLEALIDSQADVVDTEAKVVDAAIDAEITKLVDAEKQPPKKMQRVKKPA